MKALKGTLTIGILVLIGLFSANAFAQPKPGHFSNLTVDDWGWIKGDLTVDGDGWIQTDLFVDEDLDLLGALIARANGSVAYDLDVGDDLDVGGDLDAYRIGFNSTPAAVFDAICVSGTSSPSYFLYDVSFYDDVDFYGKVTHEGGVDPPYVLYDIQTRQEIIGRVKREVPPDKQGGAALFFNKDTKRLETYVASEGKFYDLAGNLLHALASVELPTTRYEVAYYLDRSTGEVKTSQKRVRDRYVIKEGYKLEGKTGQFVNGGTGEVVPREEALELYAASEGNYYDLEGSLIRSEPSEEEVEYVTEYYFDSLTGEVKVRRAAVRERHVIKRGFSFEKKTGEFVDRVTGKVVPKEMAIELKRGL